MKIAVFPGSFDPFTIAHLDLVERALSLFDKVIIAIGVNSSKSGMMSIESRTQGIRDIFKNESRVEVQSFTGLTVHFCIKNNASYILRGLRNTNDLEFENIIAQNNLQLAPQIETFFLLSRNTMSHISSTIVRDIWRNKGEITHLVPAEILKILHAD